MESDGEAAFSLALRSQEGTFLNSMMKFALLFLAEGPNLQALWVVRLHLWMVHRPFKEKMKIHQRLAIGKLSDIGFTPFGVKSMQFQCLPQLAKYLHPPIVCHPQV